MKRTIHSFISATIIGAAAIGSGAMITAGTANALSAPTNSAVITAAAENLMRSSSQPKPPLLVSQNNKKSDFTTWQQSINDELSNLVAAGVITSHQRGDVLNEMSVLIDQHHLNMSALKNMSDAEYKAKMQELRSELENWVESHGLKHHKLEEAIGAGK